MEVIKEVSAKELAKLAREDVKARLASGFVATSDEILVDLASGELLLRGKDQDIVIKVIVKSKRLEIVIEDDAECDCNEDCPDDCDCPCHNTEDKENAPAVDVE
ncbi:MAG: hypothetical protein KQ78_01802 [Candidatus Izimaplasma bacterium HR2]|nr:MAG: hypothetical protein KQ78_01802 [Candidatus Izimaplasma bacterium HR2]